MGKPVTVFIVDDDSAVREGFARLLRSAGMDARPYADAETFLAEVSNVSEACILLDITMPRMTGLQVQAHLNQRAITVPVISVSALDDEYSRACARDLGSRTFLCKPVDDQAMLDAINAAINTVGPPR